MNHEVDWTYLYPSFGLLMRAFDLEADRYKLGFAITPNRVTIHFKDALNAYKFFVLHSINNSLAEEIAQYDSETIYYSICYLVKLVETNDMYFSHYFTTTDDDEKITFRQALDIFKEYVEASFNTEP